VKAFGLDDVERLRRHLAASFAVYEPCVRGGDVAWMRSDGAGSAQLGARATLPLFSPKQFLFAERERLFRFDGKRFVETLPEVEPRALVGVRACDLTAIAVQDRFFAHDPYYARRRQATLLVGIDCGLPCERGFCHAIEAGPGVREGTADLVLTRDGDAGLWTLVVCTPAGERALRGLALDDAANDWASERREREARCVAAFADARDVAEAARRVDAGEVSAATWDALGLQCLACSGCTSVCPTCSCFATTDVPIDGTDAAVDAEVARTGSAATGRAGGAGIARDRVWDSCLYEGFQREASGHHPAARPGQRVERFWTHKLSHAFADSLGRQGCVGCGRCDQTCPGFIGARSVFRRIAAA
jgi:ferredoxin